MPRVTPRSFWNTAALDSRPRSLPGVSGSSYGKLQIEQHRNRLSKQHSTQCTCISLHVPLGIPAQATAQRAVLYKVHIYSTARAPQHSGATALSCLTTLLQSTHAPVPVCPSAQAHRHNAAVPPCYRGATQAPMPVCLLPPSHPAQHNTHCGVCCTVGNSSQLYSIVWYSMCCRGATHAPVPVCLLPPPDPAAAPEACPRPHLLELLLCRSQLRPLLQNLAEPHSQGLHVVGQLLRLVLKSRKRKTGTQMGLYCTLLYSFHFTSVADSG